MPTQKTKTKELLERLISGSKKFSGKTSTSPYTYYACECTPELAQELIHNANIDNRKVRQNKVMEWARYIKRGDWMMVGSVVFSDRGRIIDGQHRLLGCIEAGVPISFLLQIIPENYTARFSQYIDIGVPRTLADYLHFNEVDDAERTAPALVYERNFRVTGSPFQSAKTERREYLRLWEDITHERWKRTFDAVPQNMHRALSLNRAFLDWFSLQLVDLDPEGLAMFLEYVVSPTGLRGDNPMFMLHQKLTDIKVAKRQKRNVSEIEQAVLIIKAWNLNHANTTATPARLRYRVSEDWPDIAGTYRNG